MRKMNEIKELLDKVEEGLLEGHDVKMFTSREDILEYGYELAKVRRLLIWILEVRKHPKKEEDNHKKLTEFGIDEDKE